MVKLSYLLNRIRDVKLSDYLSVFPMTIAIIMRPFYRKKYENVWLICEEPSEARDNGYHFFRYLCTEHPELDSIYAIKRNSVDYQKIKELGRIIEYGSVKHWIVYFLCKYNISSQKGGKPNAALCSFMELNGIFKTKNIFLQHGVIINNLTWLYSDKSKIYRFITSTIPETNFIKEKFGYPEGAILCTGLPRFDALHDFKAVKGQVIIMPTWRYWFNLNSKKHVDTDKDFETSEYVKRWKELLNSSELKKLIKEYQLNVIFYLHRNLQKYDYVFYNVNPDVKIASWKEYDIQELLKESSVMITDYSSVFFDMVYMRKPIIFYQFDEDKYRKYQYNYGYFDYHNNPFGKSFRESKDVINELEKIAKTGFSVSQKYIECHKEIFENYDNRNSERIYESLIRMTEGKER